MASSSAPQSSSSSLPSLPSPVRSGRLRQARTGMRSSSLRDLYHSLMTISWGRLIGLVAIAYLVLNTLFACAYLAGGDCIAEARPGSIRDAFFFSVQTLATIGYGRMYPKTTYADVLVACEALCGMLGVAMATGLMFSKFARPTARILFSKVAVISKRDGVPSLMFRIANGRNNQIVAAQIRVVISKGDSTSEGERVRRVLDLGLVRDNSPLFTLTWTTIHPIDAKSPLYGVDPKEFYASDAVLLITLTGIDETFSQTVHTRHAYGVRDILWGHRFVDILSRREDGAMVVDYRRFHDTMPVEATGSE